jgi:hypothetical protein
VQRLDDRAALTPSLRASLATSSQTSTTSSTDFTGAARVKSRDSFIWRAFSLMSQNLHSSFAPQYWQLRKIVMNAPKATIS